MYCDISVVEFFVFSCLAVIRYTFCIVFIFIVNSFMLFTKQENELQQERM